MVERPRGSRGGGKGRGRNPGQGSSGDPIKDAMEAIRPRRARGIELLIIQYLGTVVARDRSGIARQREQLLTALDDLVSDYPHDASQRAIIRGVARTVREGDHMGLVEHLGTKTCDLKRPPRKPKKS